MHLQHLSQQHDSDNMLVTCISIQNPKYDRQLSLLSPCKCWAAVTQAMLYEELPIFNGGAFFTSHSHGIHQSIFNLRHFQSATVANCGPLCSVMWSEWILIIPRELSILCNMDWPRQCWKILWLIVSKTPLADMGELTAALFTSQRTVQVFRLSWLSKSKGFTPDRIIQGYFSGLSCSYTANWLNCEYCYGGDKCQMEVSVNNKVLFTW